MQSCGLPIIDCANLKEYHRLVNNSDYHSCVALYIIQFQFSWQTNANYNICPSARCLNTHVFACSAISCLVNCCEIQNCTKHKHVIVVDRLITSLYICVLLLFFQSYLLSYGHLAHFMFKISTARFFSAIIEMRSTCSDSSSRYRCNMLDCYM